jgi:gas vesicle protein
MSPCSTEHEKRGTLSVLLLIAGLVIGALAGAAVAALLARSGRERLREELDAISADSRERMRDEMKSISADVLKQTGDSLMQRFGDQRRAEQERAAGEMAKRAEELKGLVGRDMPEPVPIEASAQAPTVRLDFEVGETDPPGARDRPIVGAQNGATNGAQLNGERSPAGELPPS